MAAVPSTVRVVGALHRCVVVGAMVGRDERVAEVPGSGLAGAVVAAVFDPATQCFDRRRLGIERDRGRLGNRIGFDGQHAGAVTEHLLHDRLLGRVMQTAHVQDDRLMS